MTPDPAREAWINRARAVPLMDEVERRGIKLKRVGVEYVGPCPLCGGDDRFAINADKAVWNCRGCTKGGDVIALVMWLDGSTFPEACTTLAGEKPKAEKTKKANGRDKVSKIVVASFEYHDEQGNLLFVVDRVQFQNPDGTWVLKEGKPDKKFPQRRPDLNRKGKWIYNVEGVRVVPYRLSELTEAIANEHEIYICEGEAKCNLLARWNLTATCNSGGATHWTDKHAAFLKDAKVILVPDNDGKGWEHINGVGASLAGIAKSVRVLVLPNLRPKGDVIDWEKAGGTREKLDELTAAAHDWKPIGKIGDTNQQQKDAAEKSEAELVRLARMPKGVPFAQERNRLAKELGVAKGDINDEIRRIREEFEKDAPLFGHWIVEPWPEPADGDALIRDIIRKLQKHNVISHDYALASALWAMFSWTHDEATWSPILCVTAAEMNSGKSTLLGVLSFLMPRCISSVDISKAALYRSIKRWQPSFVIDEFDNVLAASADSDQAQLRSVINTGHTRGTGVVRCIDNEHTPELFPTFCPKAVGMIGRNMPSTTLSRCIFIEMQRKKKGVRVETKFLHRDDDELQNLRSRLFSWSMANAVAVNNVEPAMPDGFDNRLEDNWRVQFAIADLAGLDWGDQARAAAAKIEKGSDNRSASERALAAIKIISGDVPVGMGSKELSDTLGSDQSSEWAEWRNGKAITQNALARRLKRFKIFPDRVTINGVQLRGYLWSWFEDAWERYL
jgi:hypothetical protein